MGNSQDHLKPELMTDLKEHTCFNEKEISQWYRGFRKDCPTEQLSLEGFADLYKDFFPNGDANKFAEHIFRSFDINHDNTIDFREFMFALNVMSKGTTDQKLQWAFGLYDLDGNGSITRSEMLEIFQVSICAENITCKCHQRILERNSIFNFPTQITFKVEFFSW